MNHRKLNRLLATALFLVAELLYLLTMAPTLSFWDCGEFIATSATLGIPHPPGAPLFLLFGRLFSMLPVPLDPGAKVNLVSTIASALTVMLTYLVTIRLIVLYRKDDPDGWSLDRKLSAYGGAVVGALALAVSDSFWFNAVEAEVYAASSLFTAAVIWMMLRWYDEDPNPGSERWILGVMYLFGLSIGVHLLCLLAVFCVAMIYYFKRYRFAPGTFAAMLLIGSSLFVLIYKLVIGGLPELLKATSWWGLLLLLSLLAGGAWHAHRKRQVLLNTACMSLLLIIIGYTSYAAIYFRAQANPPINENAPATLEAFTSYLNRDQYGDMPILPRRWSQEPVHRYFYERYSSDADYFLSYQLGHMYLRYLGWQFIGRQHDMEGAPVDWSVLWGLPLLLGAAGAVHHFRKQWPMALVVTVLFFMTGAALVIYLNQTEPQPRERDYSYVGSFFAFAIWIGIGVDGIVSLLREKLKPSGRHAALLLAAGVVASGLLLVDGRMLQANYRTHDRSGNYVPWDWAWNILQSCDRDAILFTNGDNDTFPLWYLQEVARIRTDVRVVNLSLANTGWYLLQLKHQSPRGAMPVEFSFTDEELAAISYLPADSVQVTIPSGRELRRLAADAAASGSRLPSAPSDSLRWTLVPGLRYEGQNFFRPQDLAVFDIVTSNFGKRPIYFALTVEPDGMTGLEKHLRLEGMAYRVVPMTSASPMAFLDPAVLYGNLVRTYRYRNLGNPNVHIEQTGRDLAGNYPPLFARLAIELADDPGGQVRVPGPDGLPVAKNRGALAVEVLDRAAALFPLDRFPVTPELAGSAVSIYARQGAKQKAYPYIKYLEILASQGDERRNPALFITLARAYRLAGMERKAEAVFGRVREALPDMGGQLDSLMQ